MEDVFNPIPGFDGKYEITIGGLFKYVNYNNTGEDVITYGNMDNDGYLNVCLSKDGESKTYGVHKLVALTYIDNPNNLPEVNHKDENPANNCVDNLEWCDRSYNINYGTANKRRSEKLTNGVTSKPVKQKALDGQLIKLWPSTKEIGRNGFNQGHVSDVCNGNRKTHKGFIWEWA